MKWKSFFFKGVNFNNHYRVLGDKEKIISVCDFIITCQAIFKFKKKNSCWYKRYHLQRKKSVVAFKSEKYLLRLFITCKSILFSRLRLFNSKTCDDLTDKKKFKSFNMFASLRWNEQTVNESIFTEKRVPPIHYFGKR